MTDAQADLLIDYMLLQQEYQYEEMMNEEPLDDEESEDEYK
jgi:hypothetical protein